MLIDRFYSLSLLLRLRDTHITQQVTFSNWMNYDRTYKEWYDFWIPTDEILAQVVYYQTYQQLFVLDSSRQWIAPLLLKHSAHNDNVNVYSSV